MSKDFFRNNYGKLIVLFLLIILFVFVIIVGYKVCFDRDVDVKNKENSPITISYVGDLILLMDQVKYSYDEKLEKYDFDYMFDYASKYFSSVDYSIGVFEGPVSNEKKGYSSSNYADGNPLYLGFPREFADAVKSSGIDLVTTANNHLLDKGKNGAYDTIDYLNKIGIDQVGSYKNSFDKTQVKVINVKGVKIAVLAYTMGSNYYKSDYFMEEEPNLTSIIVAKNNKYFEKVKKNVERDFERAKATGADLIMVMPHMGTQFIHTTDKFQDTWNELFISYGADIILGDHSHATQPVVMQDGTLIVNCPGNFANSYVKDDGDATAIVEFYIDRETKDVMGASVIPMYTREISNGKFQAVPIYDIYANDKLRDSFDDAQLKRVEEVQKIVTKSMIGEEVDVSLVQKRYFIDSEINSVVNVEDALASSKLKTVLDDASSVSFIGDSITNGTKNNNHGWFEPMMDLYSDVKISNISHGAYTTKEIIRDFSDEIETSNSDVYFIAIGTNDIRYRDEKICSMDVDEYIENIEKIISFVNDDAEIVLIAPWMSLVNDVYSELNYVDKIDMFEKYSVSLEQYSKENGYLYVDPNKYLLKFFENNNAFLYMVDFIHPNDEEGISLYSYSVLKSA